MQRFTIARHPPLISHRIEFQKIPTSKLAFPSARPQITHRVDFSEEKRNVTNSRDSDLAERDASAPLPFRTSADGPAKDHIQPAGVATLSEEDPDRDANSQEEIDELLDDLDYSSPAKIPKPAGEAGKPNCGGYNLEEELSGWTEKFFADVSKFVKIKANNLLDTGVSYSGQTPEAISMVCHQVRRRFSILDKYEGDWPTRDMLKAHLKYTSERFRARRNAATAKDTGATDEAPKNAAKKTRLRKGRKGGVVN